MMNCIWPNVCLTNYRRDLFLFVLRRLISTNQEACLKSPMVCGLDQSPCASSVTEPAGDAAWLFGLICYLDLPVHCVFISTLQEFHFTTADKYYIVTRMDLTVRDVFESVLEDGFPDLYLSLVFVSYKCNIINCKSAKEYKAHIT